MKNITLLLVMAAALALAALADARPTDPLWSKAVEVARKAEESRIAPLTITMNTTVRKGNGSVDHTSVVVLRATNSGSEELETVSDIEDGKDVTEETKKAEAERRKKRAAKAAGAADDSKDPNVISIDLGYHPFSPKLQERVTARREGEAAIEGRRAAVFTFRHLSPSGKTAINGKAWLDLETGTPIQVEASPDPLPRFVTRMVTTASFQVTPDGLWQPKSSTISGEGGFLFYHRIVESSATFSNFGPWPGGGRKE